MKKLISVIIGRRTLRPIVWNFILQATFLNVFIFIITSDFLHPFKWFYNWYVTFLWQGSWLYVFPLALVVVGQASASTEDYIKTQQLYPTRLSVLQQAFAFRHVFTGLLHLMIGFLIPWTYASLSGGDYERFYYKCLYSDNYCLSEKRLFLIMAGMWTSAIYFVHCHFWGTRYLEFPIVQLPKFILIKSKFFDTLQNSIKWVLVPNLIFAFFYVMHAGRLSVGISNLFGLTIEESRINTLSGLLDLRLITYLMLFSSLIVISMKLMELFYQIYLTERYHFPFYSTQNDDICLADGLNMKEHPIIQHLAFLDLMLLCSHNKSRREEIFKLSSFGGHPHLWNSVKGNCSHMIENFISELEENLRAPTQPKTSTQILKSPVRRNITDYFVGRDPNARILTATGESPESPIDAFISSVKDRFIKSPVVVFLFGDRKDMRIRHALRLASSVKWACDSLSFLACHSVKEDQFGVLINDLPAIITLLLQLKHTLDTFLKRAALAAALTRQDLQNIVEVTALKKSVKRSIYRIVNTFKYYINDIQLSKDLENQLMSYISYRE